MQSLVLSCGYFENPNLKFGANCYAVKPSPKDDEMPKETLWGLDPLSSKNSNV